MTFARNIIVEHSKSDERLLKALHSIFGFLEYAYILDWIPEQGTSIYTIIIPENRVTMIELPEDEKESLDWEVVSLDEYKRKNPTPCVEKSRKLVYIEEAMS